MTHPIRVLGTDHEGRRVMVDAVPDGVLDILTGGPQEREAAALLMADTVELALSAIELLDSPHTVTSEGRQEIRKRANRILAALRED